MFLLPSLLGYFCFACLSHHLILFYQIAKHMEKQLGLFFFLLEY